jgi:hypothetical protein
MCPINLRMFTLIEAYVLTCTPQPDEYQKDAIASAKARIDRLFANEDAGAGDLHGLFSHTTAGKAQTKMNF